MNEARIYSYRPVGPLAAFYVCLGCQGPRSYGSGQRCLSCYTALAEARRAAKRIYAEEQALARKAIAEARVLKFTRIAEAQAARFAARRAKEVERATRFAARTAKESERAALFLARCRESEAVGIKIRANTTEPRTRKPRASRATVGVRRDRARSVLFQPDQFRFHSSVKPSHVFKDALSLDALIGNSDRRFGGTRSLADVAADPTPNVLEQMLAAEGIERVIQRLSDEKQIPESQARAIVEALVDSDLLDDGSVYSLADTLRGAWQADRLLTHIKTAQPRFARPAQPNPEPQQYEHWRQRYGLARSGRVITRDAEPERFGGAWSTENALPEELREERVA